MAFDPRRDYVLDKLTGPVILPDGDFLRPAVLASHNIDVAVAVHIKHVHAVGRVLPHHRVQIPFQIIIGARLFPPVHAVGLAVGCRNYDIGPPVSIDIGCIEAVGNPQPANGAPYMPMAATLSWTPADNAASHELYFSTDADAVNIATTTSPELIPIPMPAVSGAEILAYLMEEHGLRQGELPEVGSQGVVSEILNGKRELNVRQIRALARRFAVSPAVFI